MQNRQRWLIGSAVVLFVVGLLLVSNDSTVGWFLIILGIIYIGVSTRTGQAWAASNPGLVRWGFIGVTVLVVMLVIVVGAVFLMN